MLFRLLRQLLEIFVEGRLKLFHQLLKLLGRRIVIERFLQLLLRAAKLGTPKSTIYDLAMVGSGGAMEDVLGLRDGVFFRTEDNTITGNKTRLLRVPFASSPKKVDMGASTS